MHSKNHSSFDAKSEIAKTRFESKDQSILILTLNLSVVRRMNPQNPSEDPGVVGCLLGAECGGQGAAGAEDPAIPDCDTSLL